MPALKRSKAQRSHNCRNTGIGVPERPCGFCHEGVCDAECDTCGEIEGVEDECPRAQRSCGHHCNCVWTHSTCDWCGWTAPEL